MAQAQPAPTEADLVARYRGSLPEYCHDALVIRTKAAALRPLELNRAQKTVHDIISKQLREKGHVRVIILKARQEGISTYVAARFYRRTTLYANQNSVVIADLRKRGSALFAIYERFDQRAPAWLKPEKLVTRKGWVLNYNNRDGDGLDSILTVETARDAASGRGSTIQAVHASELGFWENPEEVWTSLMQAVPDQGSEVIIESTANGVGNMFHQFWLDSVAGESEFIAIFLPWWIHEEYTVTLSKSERQDILDTLSDYEREASEKGFEWQGQQYLLEPEQIAWRRRTIRGKLNGDESLFRQEYPSTDREAFLVSGNCFFDEDALLTYEIKAVAPKRYRLGYTNGGITKMPAMKGPLRVWENPRPDGHYVIFADTATGRMSGERDAIYNSNREQGGRDFSAAWVYDIDERRFVALLHGRIVPEKFAEGLYQLGFIYSSKSGRTGNQIPALLGVERNHSSGETVVRKLKDDLDYTNLYFDRQINRRRNRMTPAVGWVTTEAKRVVMLDEFSEGVREGSFTLPDADTIRECFTFVRGENGKAQAQDGCHDDRVIAAAGCIQMARHFAVPGTRFERKAIRTGGPVGHIDFQEERHGAPRRDETV